MSDYPERGVQTGIITELIAEVQRESELNDCGPEWAAGRSLLQRVATTLTTLMQIINDGIAQNARDAEHQNRLHQRAEAAEVRVWELESIEAKTIERCAHVAETTKLAAMSPKTHRPMTAREIAAAIRAIRPHG